MRARVHKGEYPTLNMYVESDFNVLHVISPILHGGGGTHICDFPHTYFIDTLPCELLIQV